MIATGGTCEKLIVIRKFCAAPYQLLTEVYCFNGYSKIIMMLDFSFLNYTLENSFSANFY